MAHDRCQGKTYIGTKASLAGTVQAILYFPQDLKSSLKNCSKKGCVPVKKGFGLFFSSTTE